MAEAVYNASGLGLPIVMTVANRAIGAPINIWNDHTDSMSQRDCGWIQIFRRDQPGSARPAHPGLQAGRGAVAAGDGVHGRLHPDPRLRARRHADAGQVDAFLPPYEPRQVLDPTEPVSIGAMVGPEAFTEVRYLAHAKQMQALELIPQLAGRVQGGVWPRFGRLIAPTAPRTPRPSSSPGLGAGHDQGHGRRDARTPASRSACWASPRSAPSRSKRRAALPSTPSASWCWKRASPSASAASCRHRRAQAVRAAAGGYTVVAGLGGRAITKKSLHEAVRKAGATSWNC
jgi:pyruvate ferredoxin oxidoreductase alpha subunit